VGGGGVGAGDVGGGGVGGAGVGGGGVGGGVLLSSCAIFTLKSVCTKDKSDRVSRPIYIL